MSFKRFVPVDNLLANRDEMNLNLPKFAHTLKSFFFFIARLVAAIYRRKKYL